MFLLALLAVSRTTYVTAASFDGLSMPIKSTPSYLHGPPIFYSTFTLAKSGQRLNLVMDTGSSDTWAVPEGYECTDHEHLESGTARRQEDCHLGPAIEEDSFATTPVRQKHIKLSYADGEFLLAASANTSFDLNPLKIGGKRFVINQRVGLADKVAFNGDGITSGLAGLSFAALTSQYKGDNESSTQYAEVYTPLVQSVLEAGNFTRRMLSVVLGNDKLLGSLTFNGYPHHFDESKADWARQRLLQERDDDGQFVHRQYLFALDGFVFEGSDNVVPETSHVPGIPSLRAIADTGTNGILVPTAVAKAYNSLWTPDCNATAPPFSVKIDGKLIAVHPTELLLHGGFDDAGQPACHSAVMSTNSRTLILGHSFMVSAVTAIDFDDMTISFAGRPMAKVEIL